MAIVPSNQSELEETAKMFAASGFFDDAKRVAQAFVKIQAGLEMGIKPFQAMTSIHVIKGKVSIGANLVAGMLKRAGYNYKVRWHGSEAIEIVFYGPSKEELGNSTFSMKDAQQANLLGNPTWKKFPRNMLFARAMMNGARWYAPDVALGIYDPDELQSIEPQTYPQAVEARIVPSHQPPPPIDPTSVRNAPALNPHTATVEVSKDDGSYQWGQGKEGTKWFEAHRRVMAAIDELDITRTSLKKTLEIESFTHVNAEEMEHMRLRVGHVGLLVQQLCKADSKSLVAVWRDANDAIGKYASLALPVFLERLELVHAANFKASKTIDELRDAFELAKNDFGSWGIPDPLIKVKNMVKSDLSEPEEPGAKPSNEPNKKDLVPCKGCNEPIEWREAEWSGRPHPFNPGTDVSHFKTCPNADDFRKGKAA